MVSIESGLTVATVISFSIFAKACLILLQQFLFHIQGYRVSAEQQISAALLSDSVDEKPDLESLRDAAISIFNQYLSEKVNLCFNMLNI